MDKYTIPSFVKRLMLEKDIDEVILSIRKEFKNNDKTYEKTIERLKRNLLFSIEQKDDFYSRYYANAIVSILEMK